MQPLELRSHLLPQIMLCNKSHQSRLKQNLLSSWSVGWLGGSPRLGQAILVSFWVAVVSRRSCWGPRWLTHPGEPHPSRMTLLHVVSHPPRHRPRLVTSWLWGPETTSSLGSEFVAFYWLKQVARPDQIHQVGIPSFYGNNCQMTWHSLWIWGCQGDGEARRIVGSFYTSSTTTSVCKTGMIITVPTL